MRRIAYVDLRYGFPVSQLHPIQARLYADSLDYFDAKEELRQRCATMPLSFEGAEERVYNLILLATEDADLAEKARADFLLSLMKNQSSPKS